VGGAATGRPGTGTRPRTTAILALALWAWARVVPSDAGPAPSDVSTAGEDGIDWNAVALEAADLLSRYIRIDTTNPPGRETAAARFLAGILHAEGITAEVVEAAPERGSVYAHRSEPGGRGSIVLLHHLDVVPADPADWTVPPFDGLIRDGFVHGRGALDCKGVGVAQLMALVLHHRRQHTLGRDVILLGTADEETGGALGAGWIVEHRRHWVEGAALVLNEGDYIHLTETGRVVAHVAVAEKAPCWLRLTARGESGHGSTPPSTTAVTRLLRALSRITDYRPPVRVVPAVAEYFAALAATGDPAAAPFADLPRALAEPARLREFQADPRRAALIHNTLTPTVLQAGTKTNVIPGLATAELDCRLLPGEHPDGFVETLRTVIDDPDVEITRLLAFSPSFSPATGAAMQAIGRVVARQLGGTVVPSVLAGFTDSHYFRDLGIVSYGFVPFAQPDAERRRIHGTDERLAIDVLREAIRFLYHLLDDLD
jgi:acetylornithine deacetylase/succinyl-diaminopimelate desuccinylase-like protein